MTGQPPTVREGDLPPGRARHEPERASREGVPSGPSASQPSPEWRCRWCRDDVGVVALDLGLQPAADAFPTAGDDTPDPLYPLRMVLCSACGLAQLEEDETDAEEPRGVEPAALVEQARAAVADLANAGIARAGARVAEAPSPHGGSWLGHLTDRGLVVVDEGTVDLLVDSLGMMHDADQRAALAARADRLAADGVLALHVHPLGTILHDGTWNALRHGHFAYYSVTWLVRAAREVGLVSVGLWRYGLYGGTVVLALARPGSRWAASPSSASGEDRDGGAALREVLDAEAAAGVTDPVAVSALQEQVARSARALRDWLDARRGDVVVGYGAASRAVALLRVAGVTGADLAAVVDASPAKAGRAMPGAGGVGARIPIVGPAALAALRPRWVLLFVPDLLAEVRAAYPQVEAAGGEWVVAEPLHAPASGAALGRTFLP